jgi:hypothetical protein
MTSVKESASRLGAILKGEKELKELTRRPAPFWLSAMLGVAFDGDDIMI